MLTTSTAKLLPTAAFVSGGKQPQFEPLKSIPSRLFTTVSGPGAIERAGGKVPVGIDMDWLVGGSGGPTGTRWAKPFEEKRVRPETIAVTIRPLLRNAFIVSDPRE